MDPVVILGAGITGLSAGWLLSKKNIPFVIIEKNSYIGGLARSFLWHGFYCDFAAHRLFTTDESVLHQFLNLVPMGRHIRRSKIYLNGHWLDDPLNLFELGVKLPVKEKLNVTAKFLFRPKFIDEMNFEDYVLKRYGKGMYQIFFQPYTEKLFGIPGEEISLQWAQQKVRLSNPLDNYRENTKTKFQYFYYPLQGGYGAISNQLFNEIKEKVILNTSVSGFEMSNGEINSVKISNDSKSSYITPTAVISTIPITNTLRLLNNDIQMPFQKVDAVYLLINKPFLTDYHWIYFVDKDISINRLVEFKNLSNFETPQYHTVICAEVTENVEDPIHKVIEDLIKVNLIEKEDVLDTKRILERFAYPVYTLEYETLVKLAKSKIQKYSNLFSIGRAAEFKHREADDNFAMAKQTVDFISTSFYEDRKILRKEKIRSDDKTRPKVFIVLLALNNYADTHECITSLFQSDFPDLKIVLVDNGSKDKTPEKVRKNFPQVYVIENKQNLGVPAGYNVGFTVLS